MSDSGSDSDVGPRPPSPHSDSPRKEVEPSENTDTKLQGDPPSLHTSREVTKNSAGEEFTVHVASLNANKQNEDSFFVQDTLFGVVDGHGGAEASTFLGESFPSVFFSHHKNKADKADEIAAKFFSSLTTPGVVGEKKRSVADEMEDAFVEADEKVIDFLGMEGATVGACVTAAYVENRKVFLGNAGDTRAVIYGQSSSVNKRAFHLQPSFATVPHTTSNRDEVNAVRRRSRDRNPVRRPPGDPLEAPERVAGIIMVTRSLGDSYLKIRKYAPDSLEPYVPYISGSPELQSYSLQETDGLLVLASDGLWDHFNEREVGAILEETMENLGDENLAEVLVKKCLNQVVTGVGIEEDLFSRLPAGELRRRLHDDITVVVVQLPSPFFKEVLENARSGGAARKFRRGETSSDQLRIKSA